MAVKKETVEKEKIQETKAEPKTTKKIATGSTKKVVQKRSSSLVAKKDIEKKNTKKVSKVKEDKNDLVEQLEVKKSKKEKIEKTETEPKKEKVIKEEGKQRKTTTKKAVSKDKEEVKKQEKNQTKEIKPKKEEEEKVTKKETTTKKVKKEEPIIEKFDILFENDVKENIDEKVIKNEKIVKEKIETKEETIQELPKKETKLSIKEMEEIQAVVAKEMKLNKRLPEVEFQKISTRIFQNICLAVIIMCYLNFVILGFINIENSVFITDLKVFSLAILIIAIGIIEYAYKKESGRHAIHGIEMIILALITIGLVYLNIMLTDKFIVITVLITYAFSIYYIIKALFIFNKMRKKYFMENMREIIRK